MRKHLIWLLVLALLGTMLVATTACVEKDGPLEEAGEELDEAVEDVGDAVEDVGDKVDGGTGS